MKKPIIAMIVLIIAAGISIGMFLNVKKKKDNDDKKQAAELSALQLFNFDAEALTRIEFNCKDGVYHAEKQQDGNWRLVDTDSEFMLDQVYFQLLGNYTSTLTADSSFTSTKLSDFGLDSPQTIKMFAGTETYNINVGSISPTGNSYYISVEGSDKIYTISSLYGSVLHAQKMMLKSKNLLPFADNEVCEIIVKRGSETAYHLTYDKASQTWSLPPEYSKLTFKQTAVTSMIAGLTRLTADFTNMMEDELTDLSKYGFDAPFADVTFKALDGRELNILFSNKQEANGSYTYALLRDTDQVQRYNQSELSFIYYNPIRFILDSQPVVEIMNLKSFNVSFGDVSESYTVNLRGSTAALDSRNFDLTDPDLNVSFRNYLNSISVMNFEIIDVNSKPELEEPVLTAEFTLNDDTTVKYQLVQDEEKLYAFINGEYTGIVLSSELLTGKNSVKSFHDIFFKTAGMA